MLPLTIKGKNKDKTPYVFKVGDVIRFKVFEKKNVRNVCLQKDFTVTNEAESVDIDITSEETKIGDFIDKTVEYWYEIELNPDTLYADTIVGYERELGPAIFWLSPEGGDMK